jgi:hypothetical protein
MASIIIFVRKNLLLALVSTFDEVMAKSLIGQTLPGEIERIEVYEYEFVVPGRKK